MSAPNVFPLLADPSYSDNGLDLHDLAALLAFQALVSKFGERYSGLGLDPITEQAWKAADAFIDARRDPKPRPKDGVPEPSAAELRKVVEALSRIPFGEKLDQPNLATLVARARALVGPSKADPTEGGAS
jgi:hypothetical protein